MTLKCELKLAVKRAAPQDGVPYTLRLLNRGREPLRVIHPALAWSAPVWRAIPESGEAVEFARAPSPFRPEREVELPAGGSFQAEGDLLRVMPDLLPGAYRITAEYPAAGGAESATSNDAPLELIGPQPTRWWSAEPAGVLSVAPWLLWIDQTPKGPHLKLSALDLATRPGVGPAVDLGKWENRGAPALAVAAGPEEPPQRWLAWLEGLELHAMRLSGGQPDGKRLRPHKLPDVPTRLLAPVLPTPEDPTAAAAVLSQHAEGGSPNLQIALLLGNGRLEAGPYRHLEGAGLLWGAAQALADGSRVICTLSRETAEDPVNAAVLDCTLWSAGSMELSGTPVGRLTGRPLCAGLWLTPEQTLSGAALVHQVLEGSLNVLQVVRWERDAGSRMELLEPAPIEWPPDRVPTDGALAADIHGGVFGLVREAGGPWQWFDAETGALRALPDPPARSTRPVSLHMLGLDQPAVLHATPTGRFKLLELT